MATTNMLANIFFTEIHLIIYYSLGGSRRPIFKKNKRKT